MEQNRQEMQQSGRIVSGATNEEMMRRIAEMRDKVFTGVVYQTTIQIKEILLGGIPKNPDLIKDWLLRRAEDKPVLDKEPITADALPTDEFIEQVQGEVFEPTEEKGWTTFKADSLGIYIEERQIKAMLREGAKQRTITKERGFRDALAHGLFTSPKRIRPTRNGLPVIEPDGFYEAVAHVQTPQGPRSAIKRHDYVIYPTLEFIIVNANGGRDAMPTEGQLLEALVTCEEIGLGASRSVGTGKFSVLDFHKMSPDEHKSWLEQYTAWEKAVGEGEVGPATKIAVPIDQLTLVPDL
jgi:hypothetical protein